MALSPASSQKQSPTDFSSRGPGDQQPPSQHIDRMPYSLSINLWCDVSRVIDGNGMGGSRLINDDTALQFQKSVVESSGSQLDGRVDKRAKANSNIASRAGRRGKTSGRQFSGG